MFFNLLPLCCCDVRCDIQMRIGVSCIISIVDCFVYCSCLYYYIILFTCVDHYSILFTATKPLANRYNNQYLSLKQT